MTTTILIILNPFNLLAFYLALSGLAIWGVGSDYKIDYSVVTIFKVFIIPTIIFSVVWFGLRYWRRFSNWLQYLLTSVISFGLVFLASEVYWAIVGR